MPAAAPDQIHDVLALDATAAGIREKAPVVRVRLSSTVRRCEKMTSKECDPLIDRWQCPSGHAAGRLLPEHAPRVSQLGQGWIAATAANGGRRLCGAARQAPRRLPKRARLRRDTTGQGCPRRRWRAERL